MKSLTRVLVALAGFAIAVFGLATVATAAPYSNQLTLGTSAQSYPSGGPAGVAGTEATGGGTVTFSILGESIGGAVADATGHYSASVTLPSGVCGAQTIQALDVASGRTATSSITITCTKAQASGTSNTGVAVASISSVAAALLLGGGLFLLLGRRRRKGDA